jgi:hypothetical protein
MGDEAGVPVASKEEDVCIYKPLSLFVAEL